MGFSFITLLRIESMGDSIVKVLAMIHEDECNPSQAGGLVRKIHGKLFLCFKYEVDVESVPYYK